MQVKVLPRDIFTPWTSVRISFGSSSNMARLTSRGGQARMLRRHVRERTKYECTRRHLVFRLRQSTMASAATARIWASGPKFAAFSEVRSFELGIERQASRLRWSARGQLVSHSTSFDLRLIW